MARCKGSSCLPATGAHEARWVERRATHHLHGTAKREDAERKEWNSLRRERRMGICYDCGKCFEVPFRSFRAKRTGVKNPSRMHAPS